MDDLHDLQRFHFVPGSAGGPLIVGGEGSHLVTADGRRILDAAGGAIVVNVGHGRPEIVSAVASAMADGAYVVPIWPTPHRLALRDRLVEGWLPEGFTQVFFTSGGSESTDSAIRLARAHHVSAGRPERWKVIGRHPSFHGMTLGTIAAASHSGRQAGFEPLLLDFPKVPWDDAEAVVDVIRREDPDTIAAFIAEPITGAAGACLVASDEYWSTVSEACERYGILLIADEVMTGYGRTGRTWGHQHFPIRPDIIVGGKGLGSGYVPMGMVATRQDVAAPIARMGGFMFFTYSGTDAMCAGAAEVLRILEDDHLVERSRQMGDLLGRRLDETLGDHPNVAEVRGRGLFRGIELVRDRDRTTPFPRDVGFTGRVIGEALRRDVWVYPAGSGPVHDAVMLGPPFVVTADEIDTIVGVLAEAISAAAVSVDG
jgi:adenosylmethionine-8-amino-7-oxononanoate aminotransferase